MGIPIPGKMVFILRQDPDVFMYAAKAWCDLWHVASNLNISITANTTRIILWNFLEIYNFHYMVRSRWIKWLTILFHVSLISALFAYVIVLVSWIVLVDIFHKNLHRFKKRGRLDGFKETVIVKSNMVSCFARCSPKITRLVCWNLCWQFGKSQGTIFCELCGNPVITSNIMCGMK